MAIFNIVFWRDDERLATVPWDAGLEKAKEHARFYRKVHGATLVQVVSDDTGEVVASYSGHDPASVD